jgi:hypothetical protein
MYDMILPFKEKLGLLVENVYDLFLLGELGDCYYRAKKFQEILDVLFLQSKSRALSELP